MDVGPNAQAASELWAIEIRHGSAPTVSRGFHGACQDFQPARKFVVHAGNGSYPLAKDIRAATLPAITDLAVRSSAGTGCIVTIGCHGARLVSGREKGSRQPPARCGQRPAFDKMCRTDHFRVDRPNSCLREGRGFRPLRGDALPEAP